MKRLFLVMLISCICMISKAQTAFPMVDMEKLVQNKGLLLIQNHPNPFRGNTDIYLAVIHPAPVAITVTDLNGNVQTSYTTSLPSGIHQFRLTLGKKGIYAMGARQGNGRSSIVLFCNEAGSTNRLEYVRMVEAIDPEVLAEPADPDSEGEDDSSGYAAVENAGSHPTFNSPQLNNGDFRVALSLSPFTLNQFDAGYTFNIGGRTATTPEELQSIYRDLGSTEMYVRLATKRHKTYKPDGTLDNTTDGKKDENANVHTFDQVMHTCRMAASLGIPINPEVMCAYIYMDMDGTQAPRFYESDYPELYAKPEFAKIMRGREDKWEELSLDEITTVLEIYGEFVGDSILATGAIVNDWNLGNEANFGFAGIGIGMPNRFDRKLAKAGVMKRYMSSLFDLSWLKKHVWKYEAQTLAAVRRGIERAYAKAGISTENVRFSTHIATVVSTPRASASFFRTMEKYGYRMETAGISFYPSAPAMSANKWKMLTKTVTRINKKCGIPVFIGEFSYPSQEMVGPFAGWNKKLGKYDKNQKGQADIYSDVIAWGKRHGLIGIRYWAPDYEGEWYPMSMFTFENKVGTAKSILLNHEEIVK